MKYFVILAISLLPFTASSQTYSGDQKEIDKILELVKKFSADVMASDYTAVANAYTSDAMIMPTGRDIMEGKEIIEKYWTRTDSSHISYHKITPKEIAVMGDTAYDIGRYEGTTTKANGEQVSWKGKYVIIWKKEDGEWKIYTDIWNRS